MQKRLWTSQIASDARSELTGLAIIALINTIIYIVYYSLVSNYPGATIIVAAEWIICTFLFLSSVLPKSLTEKKISKDLSEQKYVHSNDQDVKVSLNADGSINSIKYKGTNYNTTQSDITSYSVKSNPLIGNPQIHFIKVGNWEPMSIAVVTEKQWDDTILTTVYDYRPG